MASAFLDVKRTDGMSLLALRKRSQQRHQQVSEGDTRVRKSAGFASSR